MAIRHAERGEQRVAVVSGAAAGIGRATALALARAGFEVYANDVGEAALASLVREGTDAAIRPVVGNVADERDVARLIEIIRGRSGRLDALIHSAGVFPRLSFALSTIADLDRVMGVNFRGAFLLASQAAPVMARHGGAMVFLTSGSGSLSALADPMQAEFSLYGASKAALDRWALGVAPELARSGVAVNTITPGAFVLTPGVAALGLKESGERPSISAEAVAEAVAWLAGSPPGGPCGQRLAATDFPHAWGPRAGAR